MITNFDGAVGDYVESEGNPFRTYIERATLFSMLKDVGTKSVLDLACGPGNHTRTIKKYGATFVMGVDISEEMVTYARLMEEKQPLGIEYKVQDVRKLEQIDSFDIVTAVYLFPYARTKQALVEMVQAIYSNLKPNGRLIAMTGNPNLLSPNLTEKYLVAAKKHHIYMSAVGPIQDGMRIETTLLNPPQMNPFHLVNYYWSRETYESILKEVGFQRIEWHPMIVLAEGIEKYGKSYWEEYLKTPHIIVLEGYK